MIESQQNKGGLKTFLFTFAASLLLFGAFYLLVNGKSNNNVEQGIESAQQENLNSYIGSTRELEESATIEDTNTEEKQYPADETEVSSELAMDTTTDTETTTVLGAEVTGSAASEPESIGGVEENITESPFAALVEAQQNGTNSEIKGVSTTKADTSAGAVLSGNDTNQSTVPVPDTGNISITLSIFASVALFGFFIFVTMLNPRKYALSRFESDASGK